jgi:ABC-type spermidine/putrescine transport system permease subunit II
MLLMGVFLFVPIVWSFFLSFTEFQGFRDPEWTGLDNYARLVSDPVFWQSLGNTVVFTALTVPIDMAAGVGLAVLLNSVLPGRGIFRTIIVLPMVISGVASAMISIIIFYQSSGIITKTLQALGLPPIAWQSESLPAMLSLVLTAIWLRVGFNMIIYLAGLQNISPELYEAARIDGATRWQQFRSIATWSFMRCSLLRGLGLGMRRGGLFEVGVAGPQLVGGEAGCLPPGVENCVADGHDGLLEEAAGVLRRGGPVAVELAGGGHDDDDGRELCEHGVGVRRQGDDGCTNVHRRFRRANDAGGRARAAGDEQHVTAADRRRSGLADDMGSQPEVHEAHRDHLQRDAGAARAVQEDPASVCDLDRRAIEIRRAPIDDRGERSRVLERDRGECRGHGAGRKHDRRHY